MFVNQATDRSAVSTSKILLVPYESHHVPTYHEWMEDEDIQQATASEPLTLEEEFEMQKSWRQDSDKLTFIACLPVESGAKSICAKVDDTPSLMIGDVNLFLTPAEDEESSNQCIGEIELMIAPIVMRGQGRGRATLSAFLHYIHLHLEDIIAEYQVATTLQHLRVKISSKNDTSIKLFTSLGFEQVGEANYFGELEFVLSNFVSEGVSQDVVEGYRELAYTA